MITAWGCSTDKHCSRTLLCTQLLGIRLDESPYSNVRIQEEAETRSSSWISVAHCLLWVLANNCFHSGLQNTAHDGAYPHQSNITFVQPTLYSLPNQAISFPIIQSRGEEKRSLLTISTRDLRENLQAIANGLKTFSPVQEYKEWAWSLLCGSQADLCCWLLFT